MFPAKDQTVLKAFGDMHVFSATPSLNLQLLHRGRHRQYTNKGVLLYANKTLLVQIGMWLGLSRHDILLSPVTQIEGKKTKT